MAEKKSAKSYVKSAVKRTVRRKKKKLVRRYPIVAIVLLVLVATIYLSLCAVDHYDIDVGFDVDMGDANVFDLFAPKKTIDPLPIPEDGEVLFHFIDVGQGDAILVTTAEGNMLVDTSEVSAREQLDVYLKSTQVTALKYLVLTHPDADHIGNAAYIIENYDVENVILNADNPATTNLYENLLDVIEENNINVISLKAEETFDLGALRNTIIGPSGEYSDPNEMSYVIKAVYGETSAMLTGDAEKKSEADIIKKWSAEALQCNILKIGHHGSDSSTTDGFLNAVDPEIAVISCGAGNKYGHPMPEILEKLAAKGITVYRTDTQGSIIFKTDGKSFTLVETRK